MNEAETARERRLFTRIPLDRPGYIHGPDVKREIKLLDICLGGCLLELDDDWSPDEGVRYEITMEYAPGASVDMTVSLAHRMDDKAGFRCEHISLESISHLRRMLEKYLSDPDLAYRDYQDMERRGLV